METITGLARLADVHPHHVARIEAAVADMGVGTVATYRGSGTYAGGFFTGIRHGSEVVVCDVSEATGSRSIVKVWRGDETRPASLSAYEPAETLEPLPLDRWDDTDILRAKEVAEQASEDRAAQALTFRRAGVVPTERVLALLDEANALSDLAFALGIWREYERDVR